MKRPMLPTGHKKLQDELAALKAQRPEIADEIEKARANGDLSENADYDAAKDKSGMVEAKIRDLEARLAQAEVIDPTKISSSEKVVFGLTVEIEDADTGDTKQYTIVGSEESDLEKGRISYETPLAKAMIGKAEGDDFTVKLPGGAKEYIVNSITNSYQ
jgi:transcription elongation factor GreA